MIITVELEKIANLIKNGTVVLLDKKYCRDFNTFLCEKYPWHEGYGDLIDWDATPAYKRIKNVQLFSIEAQKFIRDTCVSKYEYLAIVYAASQPGVVGKFDDIIFNLNNLNYHVPWVSCLVGAKKNENGVYELVNSDFIEVWTGKCTLTAPDTTRH